MDSKYPAADLPADPFDSATGEVLGADDEGPRFEPRPEQPPRYAPSGQDIIPEGYDRAADGALMRSTAATGGQFIDLLEDGAYSRQVQNELRKVAAQMAAISDMTGNKTKGKVTLTLDLEKEGEHFSVRAKVVAKAPEMPRPKSVVWQDQGGNFTRFPPGQAQMFGTRPVRNPT